MSTKRDPVYIEGFAYSTTFPFLCLEDVELAQELADSKPGFAKVRSSRYPTVGVAGFISAYRAAGGDPYKLSREWHISRNEHLATYTGPNYAGMALYEKDGVTPTAVHNMMMLWAYSPHAKRGAHDD